MDSDLYVQYCDFWELFKTCERYSNRKTAAFSQWRTRSEAARQAMINHLREKGAPANRNPYFWIQDFPEPEPTDWNGRKAPEETEIACYNGQWGMYTLTDIKMYGLQTKGGA